MIRPNTRQWRLLAFPPLLLGLTLPAHAAFITDRIEAPLYAEKHRQGEVLKKLPSGTEVDILMKDGELARIRTREGTTGWVEFKLISAEKPLGLEYLELRSRYEALREELAAAREATGPGISEEELARLRQDAKDTRWMKAEMNKARARAKKLEGELAALRDSVAKQDDDASAVQAELARLRAQNEDLETRLTAALLINEAQRHDAEAVAAMAAPVIDNAPATQESGAWPVKPQWFLGSLAAAFIIGGIGGVRWLDRRIRKKHGGFRLY